MKNSTLFFIFFVLIVFKMQGQNHCADRYMGDSLFREGKFSEAVVLYKGLMPNSVLRRDLHRIAACFCNMEQVDSANYYFDLALEKGFYYPGNFELGKDKNLACLKDSPQYEEYLEKLKQNKVKGIHIADSVLYKELIQRADIEQFYRKAKVEETEYKDVSFLKGYIWKMAKQQDNLNVIFLDSILNKTGRWPGLDIVGWNGDASAWMIAQHADHDVAFQEKCFEFLLRAYEQENTNPHNVAYLYDRIRINKGEKQRYATQMRIIDKEVVFINLEDEERIEYYRACYNLPPIYLYKKALREKYIKE